MWNKLTNSLKEFTSEVIANNLKEEEEEEDTLNILKKEVQKNEIFKIHKNQIIQLLEEIKQDEKYKEKIEKIEEGIYKQVDEIEILYQKKEKNEKDLLKELECKDIETGIQKLKDQEKEKLNYMKLYQMNGIEYDIQKTYQLFEKLKYYENTFLKLKNKEVESDYYDKEFIKKIKQDKEDLDVKNHQIEKLNEMIKDYKMDFILLKEENERFQNLLNEKKLEQVNYEKEIDLLNKEISNRLKELESIKLNENELKSKYLNIETLLNEKISLLNDQDKSLLSLETIIDQLQIENHSNLGSISKLENNNLELNNQIIELKKENESHQFNINKLKESELKLNEFQVKYQNLLDKSNYYLSILQDTISRINDSNLIDRRIIIKLLLSYFHQKEDYILTLIASVLNFSKEDKEKLEKYSTSGYGWFYNSYSSKSLSEAWIEFLIRESENK